VLLASRLHTPEARDHHTRATRPASTARVSPAQPGVQAPNTSALACHGDSLCQRRRQSSRNSLHHHDADSHWQFRPRHTSTHQDIVTISNSSSPHWANNTPCRVHVPGAFLTTPGAVHIRGSANLAARHSRMLHWWRDSDRLGHFKHGQLEHDQRFTSTGTSPKFESDAPPTHGPGVFDSELESAYSERQLQARATPHRALTGTMMLAQDHAGSSHTATGDCDGGKFDVPSSAWLR